MPGSTMSDQDGQTVRIAIARDVRLHLAVGFAAFVLGVALMLRGIEIFGLLVVLVGLGHLWASWDARTPFLVIDEVGARMRFGTHWRGLAWPLVDEVEHLPRTSDEWWRDGRIAFIPRDSAPDTLTDLGRYGRFSVALHRRLYGVPFAAPLGWGTKVMTSSGTEDAVLGGDLTGTLRALAPLAVGIIEIDPMIDRLDDDPNTGTIPKMTGLVQAVAPFRADTGLVATLPPTEDTLPVAVIGLRLAVARAKAGLGIDDLAEQTRISAETLRAMERDDFSSCGGDFYARGNLRTVARALDIDGEHLIRLFDRGFAAVPLEPRTPMTPDDSDLGAIGGAGARHRLLAPSAVMGAGLMAALVWALTSMVHGSTHAQVSTVAAITVPTASPSGNGATTVQVTLTAAGGSASVSIDDGQNTQQFSGSLAFGAHQTVTVTLPAVVHSSDGSVVLTVGDGADAKVEQLGIAGQTAAREIIAP